MIEEIWLSWRHITSFLLRVNLRQLTTLCLEVEYLAPLFLIYFFRMYFFLYRCYLYCYSMIWTKILYMLQVYCLVSSMICAILKQGHFLLLEMPFSYFHFSLIKFTSRVNHIIAWHTCHFCFWDSSYMNIKHLAAGMNNIVSACQTRGASSYVFEPSLQRIINEWDDKLDVSKCTE